MKTVSEHTTSHHVTPHTTHHTPHTTTPHHTTPHTAPPHGTTRYARAVLTQLSLPSLPPSLFPFTNFTNVIDCDQR